MAKTYLIFGGSAMRIIEDYGIKHIARRSTPHEVFTFIDGVTLPTDLLDRYEGWQGWTQVSEWEVKELEDAVEVMSLFEDAENLFDSHINNGGKLDFSEKEYSYLSDALDEVEVGYFNNEDADSDYANELRGIKYSMTKGDTINLLKHRIQSIQDELLTIPTDEK